MSAALKNAKKKLSQTELRKFMNELKAKKEDKVITSPLAKYNELGQLTCILCKSVVRSAAIWAVHINAKQHKQNVEIAKNLKNSNNLAIPLKRKQSHPLLGGPEKKIKGILKNSSLDKLQNETDSKITSSDLPNDLHFQKSINTETKTNPTQKVEENSKIVPSEIKELSENDVLPEGFFDDPKLDAKARNQEYKDPIEEEWEKFVRAIKEADNESNAIIAEDQEEATTERQIDEIDEQITKLSRILELEKKKVEIISYTAEPKIVDGNEDDDDIDGDFDEFLDWRAKKSFN